MIAPAWIPVTVFAAFAQTVRNAAQRHLTAPLGTLGATLVRFLYGVPFALIWLLATALLLRIMQERNFALGVAYSKSEVLQVALFGLVFLGDRVSPAAVLSGTAGVFLLSGGWRADFDARTATLGIACGGCFAVSMVGLRGAELALGAGSLLVTAALTLLVAQVLQTLVLGAWLLARDRSVVVRVLRAWRVSLFAGFMGAAASAGWFTAFALAPVAHVRTLGLIELVFTTSYRGASSASASGAWS